MRNKISKYYLVADLDTLNLKPIGLTNPDISIKSTINLDLAGEELDDLMNSIYLNFENM